MVRIVTDTTAALPADFVQRYDIPVLPQVVNFGVESYLEGVDLDMQTFMDKLTSSRELPKTAAPPPELFVEVFRKLVPTGEPILCLHPSTELSGTVRSATLAKAEFPDADIRVIDTRLIAGGLATLVKLAARWAEAGTDADTIERRICELVPRCRIYFVVQTLEYLARGGRIGGASALLGSLLQVKPILMLHDGRVEALERVRTRQRALARMEELILADYPRHEDGHVCVMHAGAEAEGRALAERLGGQLGVKDVPLYYMPPAIATHAGPGVLATAFFVAPDKEQ
ncbi:MAG: DegV family protein [Chloroflexi bacterium]|jgi:DegV family protein with EDD domain|nr:DegV family protein [Chloroflexota bacterium]